MALANALAILLYLSCSVILIRLFLQKSHTAIPSFVSTGILALLALIFHATDIFFTMKHIGGWDLSLFTSLSIASWLMAFLAFLFGLRANTYAHPGIIIFPLTLITLVLKRSLPSEHATALPDPALEWHILLSLAAYALFTLAALQSLVLMFQERQLRRHNLNGFFRRLPPLQSMDKGLFQLLTSGFVLLSIGLITGAIFIEDLFAQHLVHKTVLSIIAWCIYATLLWGRIQYGWRGTTAVKWTLIGFSFLVMSYLGTKLVLEFILGQ